MDDSTEHRRQSFGVPEGKKAFDNWNPISLKEQRTLIMSDLHVNYHDREAVELALEYGYRFNVDAILILGDLNDFYSLSYWEKDPKKRNLKEELEDTKYILSSIRLGFADIPIRIKKGNHEERFDRCLKRSLPDLYKIPNFTYPVMIDAKEYDIEVIEERKILKIGSLNLVHGQEFGRMFASPVNPARGIFNKGKANCLAGHWHRTSEHIEKDMNDEVIGCWSIGCLCDLHPEWIPVNNWNHGFAIVELLDDETGDFIVYNKKIIKGKVF